MLRFPLLTAKSPSRCVRCSTIVATLGLFAGAPAQDNFPPVSQSLRAFQACAALRSHGYLQGEQELAPRNSDQVAIDLIDGFQGISSDVREIRRTIRHRKLLPEGSPGYRILSEDTVDVRRKLKKVKHDGLLRELKDLVPFLRGRIDLPTWFADIKEISQQIDNPTAAKL